MAGGFVGDDAAIGHRLRDGGPWPSPKRTERVPIVIVGGGIGGLSAAWQLERRGYRDFVLLELSDEPGGNARGGENDVSRYPSAAHYLPVPGPDAVYVRELCEELGLLSNGVWDERHLCFSPQERLFQHTARGATASSRPTRSHPPSSSRRGAPRAHPNIRDCVTRIDLKRHAHAMVRPVPGYVTGATRARFAKGGDWLYFAHSDVSGLSLFEEAQYRGVTAADVALRAAATR